MTTSLRRSVAFAGVLFAALPARASVERTWTEIPEVDPRPLARSEAGGVYDAARDRLVFFGGLRGTPLGETWAYDFATNAWTQIMATPSPAARTQHATVYDPVRNRMVIFGGETTEQRIFFDTWAFDLTTDTWTQMPTTAGPPRTDMVRAYDPVRDGL